MSICCFFGHRNAPDSIKSLLEKEIEHLIINGLADSFYVGNQGNFDMLVYSCLKKLSKKYSNIRFKVLLAYPSYSDIYEMSDIYYPKRLKNVSKKSAIPIRNNIMIEKSDIVICFVERNTGGAARYVRAAEMRGLKIINLAYRSLI